MYRTHRYLTFFYLVLASPENTTLVCSPTDGNDPFSHVSCGAASATADVWYKLGISRKSRVTGTREFTSLCSSILFNRIARLWSLIDSFYESYITEETRHKVLAVNDIDTVEQVGVMLRYKLARTAMMHMHMCCYSDSSVLTKVLLMVAKEMTNLTPRRKATLDGLTKDTKCIVRRDDLPLRFVVLLQNIVEKVPASRQMLWAFVSPDSSDGLGQSSTPFGPDFLSQIAGANDCFKLCTPLTNIVIF